MSLARFKWRWALSPLTPSQHAWIVSILPCHFSAASSLSYLSFIRGSLFIHAGFLLLLCDFLLVRVAKTWAWWRWSLKINQLSWTSLPSGIIFHGIFPSRCLKSTKSELLKSRVVILLFALFFPLMVLELFLFIVTATKITLELHVHDQFFLVFKDQV